jgi:H+/Na+-translocating ferredoxin:NAD+ oxidoreductase subunit G
MALTRPSVFTVSARTGLILIVFTVAFTAPMALTYFATKQTIAASAQEEKMKLVNEVLPPREYDNVLLTDFVELPAIESLGLEEPTRLFRARRQGKPAALVFEVVAPDGYSGDIRLLIAAKVEDKELEIEGVRVTQHKETPGLGDYIDVRKDKNKSRPWITQFNDLGFGKLAPEQWKVKKDGGQFDQVTGATVSARAVTNAVRRALSFATQNREKLFSLASGSKL